MANKYANLVGTNKIKDDYSKINTGFELVQTDVEDLQQGLAAETAARETLDGRVDTIIQGGGPDKDAELVDIRTPDASYTPLSTITVAGDMTRDMQKQFVALQADYANFISIDIADYPRVVPEINDTPRLNRALDYAKTLPGSVLHLTQNLTLSDLFKLYPNIMIKGHHMYKTRVTWTAGSIGMQNAKIAEYDAGGTWSISNMITVLIEGVTFTGHPAMDTLLDMRGIWQSFVWRCQFENADKLIYTGSKSTDHSEVVSYFNTFSELILDGRNTSTNTDNIAGMYFEGRCNYAKLNNIELWNTRYPIRIVSGAGYIHGNMIDVEGSTGPIYINSSGNVLTDIRLDLVNTSKIDTNAFILLDVNSSNNRIDYKPVMMPDNIDYSGGRYELQDKGRFNVVNGNRGYVGKIRSENMLSGGLDTTFINANVTAASTTDPIFRGLTLYTWIYNADENSSAFQSAETITVTQEMVGEELTFGSYLKGNNTPPQSAMIVLNGLTRTGDAFYNTLNGSYNGNQWTPMYKTIIVAQEDVGKVIKVVVYPARSSSASFNVNGLSGKVAKAFIRLGQGYV